MNPGKLDEHPMPLIVTTLWFAICSSTSAFSTAASTPKSPHPGHQSGSTLPFKSAIVTCHWFAIAVAMVRRLLNKNFVLGYRHVGSATQLFPDCVDNVVGHEWLAIVLSDVAIRYETGLASQIARELPAVVVFNDDRVFRILEDLENLITVQGHEPPHLQLIRCNAFVS